MSKRWRALPVIAIVSFLLGMQVGKFRAAFLSGKPASEPIVRVPEDKEVQETKKVPSARPAPVDPKSEQARLLEELHKGLRQLELGRIVKTTAGKRNVPVTDPMKENYAFPKSQKTTLQELRSVAVRAPDEDESGAIQQLISNTFSSAAFAGDPDAERQKQWFLASYLNYPKKLKILFFKRLEADRLRESFVISAYNSESYFEGSSDEEAALLPSNSAATEEHATSPIEMGQRYRHLFEKKE